MNVRSLLPISLLIVLAACAGELEMRQVAGQSNAILSTYRTSVREFAAGQNGLNAANESRLVQLAKMRAMRQAEIDARVASWRLSGDKRALERFAVLGEASAEQVLANAGDPPSPVAVPQLTYDAAAVDAIIKQLVTLQKPVTTQQRLEDLLAYGGALRTAYKEAIEKAEKDAGAAEGETSAAAAEEETVEENVEKPQEKVAGRHGAIVSQAIVFLIREEANGGSQRRNP